MCVDNKLLYNSSKPSHVIQLHQSDYMDSSFFFTNLTCEQVLNYKSSVSWAIFCHHFSVLPGSVVYRFLSVIVISFLKAQSVIIMVFKNDPQTPQL